MRPAVGWQALALSGLQCQGRKMHSISKPKTLNGIGHVQQMRIEMFPKHVFAWVAPERRRRNGRPKGIKKNLNIM